MDEPSAGSSRWNLRPFQPLPTPAQPLCITGSLIPQADPGLFLVQYWISHPDLVLFTPPLSSVMPISHGPFSRTDGLWQATCLEAFLRPGTATATTNNSYYELNFTPDGRWNSYAFDSYRSSMRAEPAFQLEKIASAPTPNKRSSPSTEGRCEESCFEFWVRATSLPPQGSCSLTAVIVLRSGETTYWATHHAGEKPDFHHPDSFCKSYTFAKR